MTKVVGCIFVHFVSGSLQWRSLLDVFSGCWQITQRSLSVMDVKRLLLLGAVEAMFEPSSGTKMLKLNEVEAATEEVSSR